MSKRLLDRILNAARDLREAFNKAYRRGGVWWIIFTASMIIIALDFILLAFMLLRFL
ncbi:hypothetical protein J7L65_03060 [Candidatus Bathyarchaeota archaeon]|nr:hypothetical protein [Candidatus Bathyarchaeota archaeon]